MTSAVAVSNISFDSTDVTDIDGIMLEHISRGAPGFIPAVRGQDDVMPGADGVFVRNRRKFTRSIQIDGWVFGAGATIDDQIEDYWDNRVALETLFTPDDHADLSGQFPNGTYTIDAWPISVEFDQQAPMLARVSITLESTEADWTLTGS